MAPEDLMRRVMALSVEDRRELFNALLNDPELNINPFDAINVRQNYALAGALENLLALRRELLS